MYNVPNPLPGREFEAAFAAAQKRLQFMASIRGVRLDWIKGVPYGPSLEHMSFLCGNQAYFILLLDNTAGEVLTEEEDGGRRSFTVRIFSDSEFSGFPAGTRTGVRTIAEKWGGFACWMPMRRTPGKEKPPEWLPVLPNWNLLDIVTDAYVAPEKLVLEEPPPMTQWEIYDFAIRAVRRRLKEQGLEVLS